MLKDLSAKELGSANCEALFDFYFRVACVDCFADTGREVDCRGERPSRLGRGSGCLCQPV